MHGISDRNQNVTIDYEKINKKNKPVFEFLEYCNFKRVSCIATLMQNYTLLDGSFRILDEKSDRYEIFEEVYKNNIHNIKDAIIAEAAIYNNCILVTKDSRLNKKVNKHFIRRSILIDDFLSMVDIN